MDDVKLVSSGKQKSGSHRKRSAPQFDNVKHKLRNLTRDHNLVSSKPIDTLYRILCPAKKIGSVLGKGGEIVNTLRDETHAKIRVADAIAGAEERVIIIFSYQSTDSGKVKPNQDPDLEDEDPSDNDDEYMLPLCPAQDALLKVHDRITADEYVRNGVVHEKSEHDDDDDDDDVIARILVPSNQVGCLLGKGGTVIQKLRGDTGASIRILPAEHLPPCAMHTDELVQISGTPSVVKKALYEISSRLHHHPRKEYPPLEDLIFASTRGPYAPPLPPPLSHGNPGWSHKNPAFRYTPPVPWVGEFRNGPLGYARGDYDNSRAGLVEDRVDEFSMRILCATDKIGGVIGKGGVNVRQLEQQTGAHIQVEDTGPDADERLILVSSKEACWDPRSPTIDAVLQLQNKASAMSEKGNSNITTRLLVPSSKVGCLIGQGGNIITEMRMRTRADIRVFSKDDKPKYTPANEELVQISGNNSVAREALIEIASRLRERTLRGGNATSDPVSHSLFHRSNSLEDFSGRGFQPSTLVATGNSTSYDHPKRGTGQPLETHEYPGHVTAAGYRGSVNAAGYRGSVNAAAYHGPASASAYHGPASASAYHGPASSSAYHGSPGSSAYQGPASSSYHGPAGASAYHGPSRASAYHEPASTAAYNEPASAAAHPKSASSVYCGSASAASYSGPAIASGYRRLATPAGYFNASTIAECHSAPISSGYHGPSAASGYSNVDSSVEIKIPNSAVSSICGTGGSNISEIRRISGARVKLHEPRSGASECVVEILGTSDQIKAAQSLLQGFIAAAGTQTAPPPSHPPLPY